MNYETLIGPPGTGKTTELLREMEEALNAGIPSTRIGFTSFTKKSVREASERARAKFNLSERALPYFRTLHSLAFWSLGLRSDQVMAREHYRELGSLIGLRLSGFSDTAEGSTFGYDTGDRMLFLENLARIRGIELVEQWRENPEGVSWWDLDRTQRAYHRYKEENGLIDFTDMLKLFVQRGAAPPLDLLLIDEAQDLSALQWSMVKLMASRAKRVIIAGDDDQGIFRWAGADVEQFNALPGEAKVLGQSYRIPVAVQEFAFKILENIQPEHRRPKSWSPRSEQGFVEQVSSFDHVDPSKGSWLVLARNSFILEEAEKTLRRDGYVYDIKGKRSISEKTLSAIKSYEALRRGETIPSSDLYPVLSQIQKLALTSKKKLPLPDNISISDLEGVIELPTGIWHEALDRIPLADRVYIVAALKRGEKVSKEPRIKLSTIHGAKGGEADYVVLFSDVAERSYAGPLSMNFEDEARVFFVGATRARLGLYVVRPTGKNAYRMPH
jgi:DNA helicase-2/ATP-dependent DNA helicase PcrA